MPPMLSLWQFLAANSAALATAVRAILLCAIAFGLEWTTEQLAAVMLAVESVLAILVGKTTVAASTIDDRMNEARRQEYRRGIAHGRQDASQTGPDARGI